MISSSTCSGLHLTALVRKPLLLTMAVLGLSVPGQAASILVDGGFESAGSNSIYFAGQTIDGGSWNVIQGAVYIDSADPFVFSGNNSLNLTGANPYVANSVSQALTTVIGNSYAVNFWANSDSPNTFSLTANGIALTGAPGSVVNNGFPGAVTNSSLFVDYLAVFKATSANTTLSFSSTANPPIGSQVGSVMIDNVGVQLIPEPGSLALTLTGTLGLCWRQGRKYLVKAS